MQAISEIKAILASADIKELPQVLWQFRSDEREGVKKLVLSSEKRIAAYEKELARMEEMFHYERLYPEATYIGGIDEVGRGPLAGPVVACCVVLPKDCDILCKL